MEPRATHVLVVEDDDRVGEMVERILVQAGYLVRRMVDALEALMWAIEEDSQVDLVIADVVMPVISGPELAGALWLRRPHIPVIYMSGYDDETTGRHGVTEPSEVSLRKPFGREELLGCVASALNPGTSSRSS
jgi:DNA-binding NtrC family response regulator